MLKQIFCCTLFVFGFSCASCAFANDSEELSNTAYLSAHQVKKVAIGKSFANCKTTKLTERYVSLKTCGSANISDVYYMAAGFFHHSATQLLSKKAMRAIDRAGVKLSVAYKDQLTSFGFNAHF